MSVLDAYRRAGCRTDAAVLALAATHGQQALYEARAALQENSEGNIQRILKASRPAAAMFQRLFGANAFAAAKACILERGLKAFQSLDESDIDYEIWRAVGELDSHGQFLVDDDNATDKRDAKLNKYAVAFSRVLGSRGMAKSIANPAVKTRDDLHTLLVKYYEKASIASKEAVVKLANGWKWIDLAGCSSDVEQKQMGHCGYDDRGKLYSLRDGNGNPHVTLTMDDKGTIHQIRGKGNSTPDRKYWQAIKQFMQQTHSELYMHNTTGAELPDMFARPDGVSPELDRFLYDEPEPGQPRESRLREAGRQNSTAMVVVPGSPPGRNVCGLVRSLSKDRSRLIVVARAGGLPPGSFERMLRASIPDCEKRVRIIESDGSLVEMISNAERNKHYSPKQALEVFCDAQLAQAYAHDSTGMRLEFDPGLVSTRPIKIPTDDPSAILKAVQGQDMAAQHRVLDPHIFSSSNGIASYRDALMAGQGQQGQAAEHRRLAGVALMEFLTDVAPSRELAIARLRDLLDAEVGIDGLQYLGSGRNGSAYRSPDGFVLKVTTDEAEVESASRLIGQQTEFLGRVFEVRELDEGVWLLIQEDLESLPEDLREEFDLAMEVLENLGAMDSLNEGDIREVVHTLAAAGRVSSRSVEMAIGVMRRFEVPGMCSELSDLGLSGDFHSGNVMLRNGSPVLIDLGTPGESPIFQIEVHHPNGRRINEFGTGAPGSGASGPPTMRGSNSSSWSNGRGALKSPANHVPEDENADEKDYSLDWGPGRVSGASI